MVTYKKIKIVQFLSDFGTDGTQLFGRSSGTHIYAQKKFIHQVRRGEPPVKDLLNKYNNFIGEAPPP